jgi:hypothetical protein
MTTSCFAARDEWTQGTFQAKPGAQVAPNATPANPTALFVRRGFASSKQDLIVLSSSWAGNSAGIESLATGRCRTKAHAGAVVIKKFDSAAFKCELYLIESTGLRVDAAFKGFHPADSPYGHTCALCKLRLIPSQQYARCP